MSISAAAEVAKEYADEPEKQKEIVETGRVVEAAKAIKESKKPVEPEPADPRDMIVTAISEVETLSREFRDLDVKEMGARFTSIKPRGLFAFWPGAFTGKRF